MLIDFVELAYVGGMDMTQYPRKADIFAKSC